MKYLIATVMVLLSFTLCIASCNNNDDTTVPTPVQNNGNNNGNNNNPVSNNMKITIGSTVFTATLYDNPTAAAFKAMLPITINMSELNSNEKFYYFSNTLPTNASPGGNIQTGDLMLYGNNCLVLFYESFNTSYSYTRLGKINNASGLATTLGNGNVTVKFELQ
jgi:hypothetical protein